ncbi:MAG: hypothetical protein LEGION0398_MBIBDBAK_00216 [Legionellaceae bacterium]
MALVLSISPSLIETGEIMIANIGLFSYIDKNNEIYKAVKSEFEEFEEPKDKNIKSPIFVLNEYGKKLVERTGMPWFWRFITGIESNLKNRVLEFGEYCYYMKQVQLEYDPTKIKREFKVQRGLLKRSTLHDNMKMFREYYFSRFQEEEFLIRLNAAKEIYDKRLKKIEENSEKVDKRVDESVKKIEEADKKIEEADKKIEGLENTIKIQIEQQEELRKALKEEQELRKKEKEEADKRIKELEENMENKMKNMFMSFMQSQQFQQTNSNMNNNSETSSNHPANNGPGFFK